MIDFKQIRYGRAEDGTIAVVLSDVARGLRRMREEQLRKADNHSPFMHHGQQIRKTAEMMRWAADFLDAVEKLLPKKLEGE